LKLASFYQLYLLFYYRKFCWIFHQIGFM